MLWMIRLGQGYLLAMTSRYRRRRLRRLDISQLDLVRMFLDRVVACCGWGKDCVPLLFSGIIYCTSNQY
jgi:hypothetical protein